VSPLDPTTLLLLLAWGTVVALDLVSVPQAMYARPVVAGTVAGLIAGDVTAVEAAGSQYRPLVGKPHVAIEPLMNNVTEIVAMEIQKTFDFYRATTEDNETVVQKILISGGGSKLAGLAQELSERLELPVEVLDPFRNIKVDKKKFDPDYLSEIVPEMAVAVGLAVRGV